MLPHPDDVAVMVRERNIPAPIAAELQTLAQRRADHALQLMDDTEDAVMEAAARALRVREEALWALYVDESALIHWPWEAAQRALGSMSPGELIVVGARTGVGKTTFLLNVVDLLFRYGQQEEALGIRVLPFETPPAKLLRLLAAIRLRYNPVAVLRNKWDDLPAVAFSEIETEMRWLTDAQITEHLQWAPQGSMTPFQVYGEMEKAKDCGCRLIVLDHLHRIALEGRNGEAEMRNLMRGLKDRAERLELVVLIGAQLNRGERDPLRRHLPPVDTDLRGGGAIEEEADVLLGLYIPLIKGVTNGQMAEVRKGLAKVKPLIRPNVTGVRVIKHRVDSTPVGEDIFLRYDHGKMSDLPEEEPEPTSNWALRPAFGERH